MASLASTGVTKNYTWTQGGVSGKAHVGMNVTCVLVAMGTAANAIPASAFGLKKILQCTNFVKSDNSKIYPAVPNADGSAILLLDETQATDANRANPADITATVVGTLIGY